MKNIYIDNAATTKPFVEEYELIKQKIDELYFNPSAGYRGGIFAKRSLDLVRKSILLALGANGGKIVFTSSATESNNMVFAGLHLRKGQVVLISKGEHPSVYNSAHSLEKKGIIVKDIPLGSDGSVDFEKFKEILCECKDIALISVMHVSNETGAINDVKKLCECSKRINKNIIFHCDGVQAFGKIEFKLSDFGVDLYTISAHKVYAPRGISCLWIKDGITIDPLLFGGGQENGLRSSTENVFGAIAFEYSINRVMHDIKQNFDNISKIKREIIAKLESSEISKYMIVNSESNSSPYILSLSFRNIKGEVLANLVESYGILISTGSACSTRKAGNRTLEAIGIDKSFVIGSVRLSFSAYDEYDVDYIVDAIIKSVIRLENNNR